MKGIRYLKNSSAHSMRRLARIFSKYAANKLIENDGKKTQIKVFII